MRWYEYYAVIINVMISKVHKKKTVASNTTKPKCKSKSKQRSKQLYRKEFLEGFINLQNTNCITSRKKRSTSRDIPSALSVRIPMIENSMESSKIRCKSSLSQHRKTLKPSMAINLCAIITEEDPVQYTENTARSNRSRVQAVSCLLNHKKMSQEMCAIKIQRAWRNFQTYKMVRSINLQERRKLSAKMNDTINLLHVNIKKTDLQKTLKIKKSTPMPTQMRNKQDQQLFKPKKYNVSKYNQLQTNNNQISSSKQVLKIKSMMKRQADMFKEVKDLIQKQVSTHQKEDLINKVMQKCQKNKKILEQDYRNQLISYQIDNFGSSQSLMTINKFKSSDESISPKSYSKISLVNSLDFDNNIGQEIQEIKIYEQQLKIINNQKQRRLDSIDDSLLDSRICNKEAVKLKSKVFAKFNKEKQEITKNKDKLLFSMSKLKQTAIQCYKQAVTKSISHKKMKKCFSLGTTVLKQILEDINIVEINNSDSNEMLITAEDKKYEAQLTEKQQVSENSTVLKTYSVAELGSQSKALESRELLQKSRTQLMKEHSEEIQQIIEKELINQLVTTIFTEGNLFKLFQPYVEEIFEFKPVLDKQIFQFVETIGQYFPDNTIMMERVNQKMNPTAMEILKIMRDVDFETQSYDLIVPECCFKDYRATVEKHYNDYFMQQSKELITDNMEMQLAEKVRQFDKQKRERMKKYRTFQRDLKIMYMKSVFNCVNEFMIQLKSSKSFMNSRSSIGPGELTLALKQSNHNYSLNQFHDLVHQTEKKVKEVIEHKCLIPSFKKYLDIEQFQKQVMKQIQLESNQTEYKWVSQMDEVLEIWQDLYTIIIDYLLREAAVDILPFFV